MIDSGNPFETPSPRGIRVVQATLRVTVALQCWGYAATWIQYRSSFALTEMLASAKNLEPAAVQQWNSITAYALLASGLITLLRPTWFILLPLGAWQTGMAVAAVVTQTGTIPSLEPLEQAVRLTLPTALLLIDFWPPKVKPGLAVCLSSIGLLRLAAATTFIGHGLIALVQFQQGGNFVELITGIARNVFNHPVSSETAQQSLAVIGVVEIAAAVALISSRNRLIALLMATWGLLTACSHTLAFGISGYPMTLMRAANCGAVLSVFIFWWLAVREQRAIILPETDEEDDDE